MTRFKKLKEKIEEKEVRSDVTFKELSKYLNHYGFYLVKTKGSHHKFENEFKESIIIPVHSSYIKQAYVKEAVKIVKENDDEQ